MAFIVYKCLCWSFLFRFLTTSGKTLSTSPAPHPHLALKIAVGVGLAEGLGVWSPQPLPPGPSVHILTPRFLSIPLIAHAWLNVLGGALLHHHFLMTVWETSGVDTSRPILIMSALLFSPLSWSLQCWQYQPLSSELLFYLKVRDEEWTGPSLSSISEVFSTYLLQMQL